MYARNEMLCACAMTFDPESRAFDHQNGRRDGGGPSTDPGDKRVAPGHESADEGAFFLPGQHQGNQSLPGEVGVHLAVRSLGCLRDLAVCKI